MAQQSKPPQMSGLEVIHALEVMDFVKDGGKGGHHVMRHPDGRTTTVSAHRSDVPPGTMRNIMRQADVTAEDLKNPRKAKRAREAAVETQAAIDKAGGTAPASEATQGGGNQQGRAGGHSRGGRANRHRGRDR